MAHARQGLFARIAAVAYGLVVAFLLVLLVGQVLSSRYNIVYYYSELRDISDFNVSVNGEERGTISAPTVLEGLESGSKVALHTTLGYRMLNNLMFQTYGNPVKVFADGRLLYSYGDPNTYPDFQKQPPPMVVSVTLPETAAESQYFDDVVDSSEDLDLRLEYTLLDTQSSLEVPRFSEGDEVLLFQQLLAQNLLGLVLGLVMLLGALALVPIGLATMRRAGLASAFIWLGLTCLACAIWSLGSNAVVIFLLPQASMLYNLKYVGFYLGIVSLLCFGLVFLQPQRRWPLMGLCIATGLFFVTIITTHLAGVFSFAQWWPYAQLVELLALILFMLDAIFELVVFRNRNARLLLIALGLLVLFSILESANQLLRIFPSVGELVQAGLAIFIAIMTFIAWQQVNQAFDAAERSEQLEAEITLVNRNLEMQRTLYEKLTTSSDGIRKLRHDMRHQLSAIKGMVEEGELAEAKEYIDTLYGAIPSISNRILCDNFAVNALAVHYLDIAEAADIQCDLRLVVPRKVGRILDIDLCVIIGNLMENAIEACEYVEEHKRFIKLSTTVDKTRFTLVMDNSFDGQLKVRRGEFYSRKRGLQGRGIGMQSVRAEVLKYDGAMKYEAENEIFKTSLYVKL
ncbi:MAG: GHKL domain-containing protein [Coriobacteriales bacterium]|jgi:hypothetical protein|nr:GHKL domain-containing protein [Coriobacteriales bacterium]